MPPSLTRPVSAGAEGQETGGEAGKRRWRRPPELPRPVLGSPFSPSALLNKAVSNVIASLIYARRFEYDDPRLIKLLGLMEEALKEESKFLNQVG